MATFFNCIILIDDDEITNFIHLNLLNQCQATQHMEVFTDGRLALKYIQDKCAKQQGRKLVLLELNMHIFDGFEFLEKYKKLILKEKSKIKVVVLTTSVNPKDIRKLQLLGIHDIIEKPLRKEHLAHLYKE